MESNKLFLALLSGLIATPVSLCSLTSCGNKQADLSIDDSWVEKEYNYGFIEKAGAKQGMIYLSWFKLDSGANISNLKAEVINIKGQGLDNTIASAEIIPNTDEPNYFNVNVLFTSKNELTSLTYGSFDLVICNQTNNKSKTFNNIQIQSFGLSGNIIWNHARKVDIYTYQTSGSYEINVSGTFEITPRIVSSKITIMNFFKFQYWTIIKALFLTLVLK